MVMVEGVQMKAKPINRSKLVKAWRTLSRKPLPKIKALELSDEDFNHVLEQKRCREDQMRELEEWGRTLSSCDTDACVFNADPEDNAEFVILIRENPYHALDEIIVHELSHIANGDL